MPVQNLINIDSLKLRHQLFDIMFIYDLLNYSIVSPELLSQFNFRIPSYTREIMIFLSFHSSSPNQVMTHSLLEL